MVAPCFTSVLKPKIIGFGCESLSCSHQCQPLKLLFDDAHRREFTLPALPRLTLRRSETYSQVFHCQCRRTLYNGLYAGPATTLLRQLSPSAHADRGCVRGCRRDGGTLRADRKTSL